MAIENSDYRNTLGPLNAVNDAADLSASHYYHFLGGFMRYLHAAIPANNFSDPNRPAHIETREDIFEGVNSKRAVVFLLTNGCQWALKSANGCTMCGHLAKQARYFHPITADEFAQQFATAFSSIDFSNIPVLNIFNNGSFFNGAEVPAEARRSILRLVGGNRHIRKLLVESRPEYITDEVIQETRALIPDTELEVAIGLETADDVRRTISINKGFSLHRFAQAARTIKRNQVGLRAYVLLKPPFYSELEGISDAISSISTAFSLGVDTVSLEAMTVQKYTLIEYLFNHGMYRLPWLWSIVEVVQSTAHLGRVVVGLFQFFPSPDSVPHNCPLCNDEFMNAIVQYDRTLKTEVFDELDCACRQEWKMALDSGETFHQNLDEFIKVAQQDLPAGDAAELCSTQG